MYYKKKSKSQIIIILKTILTSYNTHKFHVSNNKSKIVKILKSK